MNQKIIVTKYEINFADNKTNSSLESLKKTSEIKLNFVFLKIYIMNIYRKSFYVY